MRIIGDFLSRFQHLTPPHETVKSALTLSLKETLDIACPKDRISLSRGVVYIRMSSVVKNMVQVNRSKVLQNLFERLPKARDLVRDIR